MLLPARPGQLLGPHRRRHRGSPRVPASPSAAAAVRASIAAGRPRGPQQEPPPVPPRCRPGGWGGDPAGGAGPLPLPPRSRPAGSSRKPPEVAGSRRKPPRRRRHGARVPLSLPARRQLRAPRPPLTVPLPVSIPRPQRPEAPEPPAEPQPVPQPRRAALLGAPRAPPPREVARVLREGEGGDPEAEVSAGAARPGPALRPRFCTAPTPTGPRHRPGPVTDSRPRHRLSGRSPRGRRDQAGLEGDLHLLPPILCSAQTCRPASPCSELFIVLVVGDLGD